jgi:hypothetical protein
MVVAKHHKPKGLDNRQRDRADHAFRGMGDQLLDPDDPECAAWADVH